MGYRLVIKSHAELDIYKGFKYYNDISNELAVDFLDKIDVALQTIQENPLHYQKDMEMFELNSRHVFHIVFTIHYKVKPFSYMRYYKTIRTQKELKFGFKLNF